MSTAFKIFLGAVIGVGLGAMFIVAVTELANFVVRLSQ